MQSSIGLETYAGAHHAHQGGLSASQGPDLGCVETTLLLLAARERRVCYQIGIAYSCITYQQLLQGIIITILYEDLDV